jgi:hypothetical protein
VLKMVRAVLEVEHGKPAPQAGRRAVQKVFPTKQKQRAV